MVVNNTRSAGNRWQTMYSAIHIKKRKTAMYQQCRASLAVPVKWSILVAGSVESTEAQVNRVFRV
jgi:hypothetical protein